MSSQYNSVSGADSCSLSGMSGANTESSTNRPLVTNTEFSSPCETLKSLEVPSLLAYEGFSPRSKRYVLQSVIKEILGACQLPKTDSDGNEVKAKYYRLGACKQLSAIYNPNHWVASKGQIMRELAQFGNEAQESISVTSIKYRHKDEGGIEAHFSGLCRCDSVWVCPVCGPTVAEYRAKEIAQAMYLHQKSGGWCVFATFTVRHKKSHSLADTLACVKQSLSKTKAGKAWISFKDRFGFVGAIRAPEYTYTTSNGHHPHIHELWFFDNKPDVKELKSWVFGRYSKLVVKHDGFSAPSYRHGVDMRLCLSSSQLQDVNGKDAAFDVDNILSISSYLSKGADTDKTLAQAVTDREWGVPEELTKNQFKKSIKTKDGRVIDSFNSTALAVEYMNSQSLVNALMFSDPEGSKAFQRRSNHYKRLYQDYAGCFFGTQQLRWSNGLKAKFDIYDMDDKSINDAFENDLNDLMHLDLKLLQKMIKFRLKPQVLNIVESDQYKTNPERIEAVMNFLKDYKNRVNRYG